MTSTPRPYRTNVAGTSRATATLRGAKRAMGALMGTVPNGTVGTITLDGAVLVTAVAETLGWHEVA